MQVFKTEDAGACLAWAASCQNRLMQVDFQNSGSSAPLRDNGGQEAPSRRHAFLQITETFQPGFQL